MPASTTTNKTKKANQANKINKTNKTSLVLLFSVLKHSELRNINWRAIADDFGMTHSRSATRKFKNMVEKHGYHFDKENGRLTEQQQQQQKEEEREGQGEGEEGAAVPEEAEEEAQ